MRNNILLICSLILFISVGFSQSKVLKVLDDIELTDSGVMLDNNNSANGYYFFYEADKVSRKEREFIVKILDQNLNEVLSKTFIESRSSYVMQAKYNNQELMFLMYNNDDHKFIFYTLDKEGNLNKVHEYEEGVKNHSIRLNSSPIMGSNLGFYPIKNKGFLFYLKTKPKKFGYRMDYFATNGGENWSHVSDEGQHELIEVL